MFEVCECKQPGSLLCTGDVLEMGALFSVSAKDIPAFERYMAQLKSYYLDFRYFCSLHMLNKERF